MKEVSRIMLIRYVKEIDFIHVPCGFDTIHVGKSTSGPQEDHDATGQTVVGYCTTHCTKQDILTEKC